MAAPKKYPDELRERAVRLYFESDPRPVIRRLLAHLTPRPVDHTLVWAWSRW